MSAPGIEDTTEDGLTTCEKCDRIIKNPEKLCSFCSEEIEKAGGVSSSKKIVPDSDHGSWWSICRWQFFIVSFFLSAGLATLVYLGDGWGREFSFGYLFFINLATAASRLVFTIAIPVLIRCFVKHQIGKYVSFFVAIVSIILGSALVRFVFDGQPIFYEPITTIFYTVAAYKIMRSVAGFSSVFWSIKKRNFAADNKFSEPSAENVRKESRSQVIANSDSSIQESVYPHVLNNANEEKGFVETPAREKVTKPHVVEAPKNTMAKINLVLLLALISWVSVLSYYCWDGLNRSGKRDTKIIKMLDDAENKIAAISKKFEMMPDYSNLGRVHGQIMNYVDKSIAACDDVRAKEDSMLQESIDKLSNQMGNTKPQIINADDAYGKSSKCTPVELLDINNAVDKFFKYSLEKNADGLFSLFQDIVEYKSIGGDGLKAKKDKLVDFISSAWKKRPDIFFIRRVFNCYRVVGGYIAIIDMEVYPSKGSTQNGMPIRLFIKLAYVDGKLKIASIRETNQ